MPGVHAEKRRGSGLSALTQRQSNVARGISKRETPKPLMTSLEDTYDVCGCVCTDLYFRMEQHVQSSSACNLKTRGGSQSQ